MGGVWGRLVLGHTVMAGGIYLVAFEVGNVDGFYIYIYALHIRSYPLWLHYIFLFKVFVHITH